MSKHVTVTAADLGIVDRELMEARRLLVAASHTLRSYQYGNAATDLAGNIADSIDRFLATGEPQTLEGKAAQ
jgi:hypothetical protein